MIEYISVVAVAASYGSALTAAHFWKAPNFWALTASKYGRGLAPDSGASGDISFADPPLSGASPLPHLQRAPAPKGGEHMFPRSGRLPGRLGFVFDLDLKRPVKPRWPNAGITQRVNRQDAGLAAPGHGWPVAAARGVMPGFGHTEPKRGAEWWGKSPFGYFWGSFPKVTRCKSGTHSSRYRSNGYVLNSTQKNGRPRGRHRGQAPSHIWSEVSP